MYTMFLVLVLIVGLIVGLIWFLKDFRKFRKEVKRKEEESIRRREAIMHRWHPEIYPLPKVDPVEEKWRQERGRRRDRERALNGASIPKIFPKPKEDPVAIMREKEMLAMIRAKYRFGRRSLGDVEDKTWLSRIIGEQGKYETWENSRESISYEAWLDRLERIRMQLIREDAENE